MKKTSIKANASRLHAGGQEGASARASSQRPSARDLWSDDFDISFEGHDAADELSLLDEFERKHGPLDAGVAR